MTSTRLWLGLIVTMAWTGCGDDDGDGAPSCPEGAMPGDQVACRCGGGATGVAVCGEDGTLGPCQCGAGGTGGGGTGGRPDAGGAGAGGVGAGGTGGSGGAGAGAGGDEDGGVLPGEDGGTMQGSPPPTDGSQGALCEDGTDCDSDLDCVTSGLGRGYCSAVCSDDGDCQSLAGAAYTCDPFASVCSVACAGEDDTASCPAGMACVSTTEFDPGFASGEEGFLCKYPIRKSELGDPWERCTSFVSEDCSPGLTCNGILGSPTATGYCAAACGDVEDCGEPATGNAVPECARVFGLGGEMQLCVLDCSADEDGCPEGMLCVTVPVGAADVISRCTYE